MAKVRRCPECGRIIIASASECRYCTGNSIEIPSGRTRERGSQVAASGEGTPSMPKVALPSMASIKSAGMSALGKVKDAMPERNTPAAPPTPPAQTVPPTPDNSANLANEANQAYQPAESNAQAPYYPYGNTQDPYAQPVQPQQPYYTQPAVEYYEEPRKSNTGLIVGIIIAGVVLLAGIGVGAYLLEKAREFDPFGHAGFDPSGIIRLTS